MAITQNLKDLLKNNTAMVSVLALMFAGCGVLVYFAEVLMYGWLKSLAQLIMSLIVLPIGMRLWFWASLRRELLLALSVNGALQKLGIAGLRDDADADWTKVTDVPNGKQITIVAIAGQPLTHTTLKTQMEALAGADGARIDVILRDPDGFTEGMFMPRNMLTGQVENVEKIIEQIAGKKHPTCRIRLGYVNRDMKYTLVMGEEFGVYMPHPIDQETDRSGRMPQILFQRDGDLYRKFLEPDIHYLETVVKWKYVRS